MVVPPTDPKFYELVRGREAIYSHITESSFRDAFARHFTTIDELALANGRTMLHFHKNG